MRTKLYLTVLVAMIGVFQLNAQEYLFHTGFVKPESGALPAPGWQTSFTQISENIPGPGNHGEFEGAAAFKFIRGQADKVGYLQSPNFYRVGILTFWALIEEPDASATLNIQAIKGEDVIDLVTIVADSLSTSAWKLYSIAVNQEDSVSIKFTPTLPENGDCRLWIDDLAISPMAETTATQDVEIVNVSFYPNPVQDKLFVSTADDFQVVTIYNQLGSIVERKELFGNQIEIDMSEKSSGMYILHVEGRNGSSTQKIMKR